MKIDSVENEIALVVLKGVDGIFADFTVSNYWALQLLGSRSMWPKETTFLTV